MAKNQFSPPCISRDLLCLARRLPCPSAPLFDNLKLRARGRAHRLSFVKLVQLVSAVPNPSEPRKKYSAPEKPGQPGKETVKGIRVGIPGPFGSFRFRLVPCVRTHGTAPGRIWDGFRDGSKRRISCKNGVGTGGTAPRYKGVCFAVLTIVLVLVIASNTLGFIHLDPHLDW